MVLETVLIRGGTFVMGNPLDSRSPEWHPDEPLLQVAVGDFRVATTPVTAAQICAFLNSQESDGLDRRLLYGSPQQYWPPTVVIEDGAYKPRRGLENAPANQVTWLGGVMYCRWLSEKTGRHYRLPTEAEWEYAARGTEQRAWPWGDESPGPERGYDSRGQRYWTASGRLKSTMPVGSYPTNATPQGVLDILAYPSGEWCANKFVEHPTARTVCDPEVDISDLDTPRVIRGYYHRLENRKRTNFLAWFFLPEIGHHESRAWTRLGRHPIRAASNAATYGLRVVEDLSDNNAQAQGTPEEKLGE